MRTDLLFVSILIVFLAGCTNPPSENLSVTVQDNDLKMIVGAEVSVYDGANKIATGTTDSRGEALFKVDPGNYLVKVEANGHYPENKSVNVGETVTMVDIYLEKENNCESNWTCTEWSKCEQGKKYRTCVDENDCGKDKPEEEKNCTELECESDSGCDDLDPCTKDTCEGECKHEEINDCVDDDQCCPSGCTTEDNDCGECVKDIDCIDNNECTKDECQDHECVNTQITSCVHNDDCCPSGCVHSEDNDCPVIDCESDSDCDDNNDCTTDKCVDNECEYSSVDDGETCDDGICCDGDCEEPECESDSDCEDDDACRTNFTCQNAGDCDADCSWDEVTACIDDDGCCPDGCAGSDNDCPECVENWTCTEWSDCVYNERTRYCNDQNECGTEENKPPETASCGGNQVALEEGEETTVNGLTIFVQSIEESYVQGIEYTTSLRVGCDKVLLEDGGVYPRDDRWEVNLVSDVDEALDKIVLYYDVDVGPEDQMETIFGPEDYFELMYSGDEVSRGEWETEKITFTPDPYGSQMYKIGEYTSYDNQCTTEIILNSLASGNLRTFLGQSPGGYIGTSPTNLFDLGLSDYFILDSKPIVIEAITEGLPQDSQLVLIQCSDTDEIIDLDTPTCTDQGNGWIHCSTAPVFGHEIEIRYTYNHTIAGKASPTVQIEHGADEEVNTLYGKLIWPSDSTGTLEEVTFTDSSGKEYLIKQSGIGYKITNVAGTETYIDTDYFDDENNYHWTEGTWIESPGIDVEIFNPENTPRTQRVSLCKGMSCDSKDLAWNQGIHEVDALTLTTAEGMASGTIDYNSQEYDYEESAGVPSDDDAVTLAYEEGADYHGIFFSDIDSKQFNYTFDFLNPFPTDETLYETVEIDFLGEEYLINDISVSYVELMKGTDIDLGVGSQQDVTCGSTTHTLTFVDVDEGPPLVDILEVYP